MLLALWHLPSNIKNEPWPLWQLAPWISQEDRKTAEKHFWDEVNTYPDHRLHLWHENGTLMVQVPQNTDLRTAYPYLHTQTQNAQSWCKKQE